MMSVIYIVVLESQTWYPQQKLDMAKLKLEGANPVTITTEELKAGFNKSKYLEKFLECVKGHNSMRAQMQSHHLSPEQQVGCCCNCCFFKYLIFQKYVVNCGGVFRASFMLPFK
jgi:hypothetical protein